MQLIDPVLLKNNFLQSLIYLHDQPPGFNFFLGIVLKVFTHTSDVVFHLCYLALGLSIAVSLYCTLRRLHVSLLPSILVTSFFIASPVTVLYEHVLFYSYPLVAMLCMSVLFFHRYITSGSVRDGTAFFALQLGLMLTHTMFSWLWFCCITAITIFYALRTWRTSILLAAPVLLVNVILMIKSSILFGTAVVGYAYVGPNIAAKLALVIDQSARQQLIQDAVLSEFFFLAPFASVVKYQRFLPLPAEQGIPVLDQPLQSTGSFNFHHAIYVDASKKYIEEAKRLLYRYPKLYLHSVFSVQLLGYFLPAAEDWEFVSHNPPSTKMTYIVSLFNRYMYLQSSSQYPSALLLFGVPLVLLGGALMLMQRLRKDVRRCSARHGDSAVLLYLLFSIVFISLLTTSVSYGDFSRYRFMLDPLYLMLGAVSIPALFNTIFIKRN